MKKTGKILALTLGAVMTFGVVGMLAGCGDEDAGKTVMNIWIPAEDQDFAKQVAADFQAAHPEKNYKFIFGTQSESDAGDTVLKDVTNAPDCFSFSSDQINKLIQGDALARLGGEYLDFVKDNNDADAVDSATVTVTKADDSKETAVYAFPYTDNTFYMYYNKSVFPNASDIATLDRILEICVEEEKSFGFPINDSWYLSSFFFGAGLGYEVEFNASFGEVSIACDFDNAKGKQVSEAAWGYAQNSAFVNSSDSILAAGFQNDSFAAGVSGIWNKNTFLEYLGDDFAAAKLPTYTLNGEQVQLTAFAGYKLMGVSNYSKNKVDAMQFAMFYTNKENQLKHFDARGFVPTNTEAKADSRIANDVCAAAIAAQLPYTKTQKNVPSTFWNPIQGLGDAYLNALLLDDPSTFDSADAVVTAAKAIRKQSAN